MATETAPDTLDILEGTGQELSEHFGKLGPQRVRVMILPALPDRAAYSLEEFEAAMDAVAEGTDEIPTDPTVTYSREDIYIDHD